MTHSSGAHCLGNHELLELENTSNDSFKNSNDRKRGAQDWKTEKTADQSFKVECPNSRFGLFGKFIPTQTQSNHGYNMGHNIHNKCASF